MSMWAKTASDLNTVLDELDKRKVGGWGGWGGGEVVPQLPDISSSAHTAVQSAHDRL
jgi:hypothetical protein